MFSGISVRKEILEMLQKIPAGTDVSIKEIAEQTKRDHGIIYQHIGVMERVGLVRVTRERREKRVHLLKREGNGNSGKTEELLSFLETCKELGLTEIDITILKTEEEDPAAIAQKIEFSLNIDIIRQHKESILKRVCLKRVCVETLGEARKEIFGKIRTPA